MAKGGGAWKVAYADFVTAMMAFFMVMWLTSQKPEVRQAVASYFRDPYSNKEGNPTGDPKGKIVPPRMRELSAKETDPNTKRGIGVDASVGHAPEALVWTRDACRLSVLFGVADADLTDTHREQLKIVADELAGKQLKIELRSHCLRKPLPPDSEFADHWELCYARCLVVKRELESLGIDPRLMRLSQAEGNEPLAATLGEEEIAKNSRVDVFLLPQTVDLP